MSDVTRLANWENIMMYSEFAAAFFVSIENAMKSTARLIGPPPIPRNADISPMPAPIDKQPMGFVT